MEYVITIANSRNNAKKHIRKITCWPECVCKTTDEKAIDIIVYYMKQTRQNKMKMPYKIVITLTSDTLISERGSYISWRLYN